MFIHLVKVHVNKYSVNVLAPRHCLQGIVIADDHACDSQKATVGRPNITHSKSDYQIQQTYLTNFMLLSLNLSGEALTSLVDYD